jgi:hypothetical protein
MLGKLTQLKTAAAEKASESATKASDYGANKTTEAIDYILNDLATLNTFLKTIDCRVEVSPHYHHH